MLQPWIVSKDGRRAVSNMVKCLGFALQGKQWNSVSFSPHSVVCPLFNLTRCFSSSDLCLDEAKVVSYITQLIRDSQRFSHWKVRASDICSAHACCARCLAGASATLMGLWHFCGRITCKSR